MRKWHSFWKRALTGHRSTKHTEVPVMSGHKIRRTATNGSLYDHEYVYNSAHVLNRSLSKSLVQGCALRRRETQQPRVAYLITQLHVQASFTAALEQIVCREYCMRKFYPGPVQSVCGLEASKRLANPADIDSSTTQVEKYASFSS